MQNARFTACVLRERRKETHYAGCVLLFCGHCAHSGSLLPSGNLKMDTIGCLSGSMGWFPSGKSPNGSIRRVSSISRMRSQTTTEVIKFDSNIFSSFLQPVARRIKKICFSYADFRITNSTGIVTLVTTPDLMNCTRFCASNLPAIGMFWRIVVSGRLFNAAIERSS